MRITCTFCGSRDSSEFSYLGDASLVRPTEDAAMHDYVYLRDNPAGPHEELWYHAQGCRSWLRVSRDTLSHEILAVRLVADK
jgi:methylglutamate dehydrogenase subunit B